MTFENPLIARWRSGGATIGSWLSVSDPIIAELIASCGFDEVILDQQHGSIDLGTLPSLLQAVTVGGAIPITRVPWNDPVIIGKSLDLGALGVVVPMVDSPEEAAGPSQRAATRPPERGRPVHSGRTLVMRSNSPADWERVACVVMVETATGLRNVEAIAATPGLDGIYIGPGDLAIGLGMSPYRAERSARRRRLTLERSHRSLTRALVTGSLRASTSARGPGHGQYLDQGIPDGHGEHRPRAHRGRLAGRPGYRPGHLIGFLTGSGTLRGSDRRSAARPIEQEEERATPSGSGRLRDRVVVVTGASSGIGRSTALAFGRAGGRVVLAARREDRLWELSTEIDPTGARTLVVPTDVSDRAAAERLVERTLAHWGQIDVLVANAGTYVRVPVTEVGRRGLRAIARRELLWVALSGPGRTAEHARTPPGSPHHRELGRGSQGDPPRHALLLREGGPHRLRRHRSPGTPRPRDSCHDGDARSGGDALRGG